MGSSRQRECEISRHELLSIVEQLHKLGNVVGTPPKNDPTRKSYLHQLFINKAATKQGSPISAHNTGQRATSQALSALSLVHLKTFPTE
jgi:hypothetical protein